MVAIYNEIDPFAANWMRELARQGHIAEGVVNETSITDLRAADVAGPGQRHFFAGIGGWSYALRLAGVPDDADVWTGSCPCQPFSDAGKRLGVLDTRHLWPTWFALIAECRPPTIFGEQVASRAGLAWFDLVRADLEGCGYAVGASDLCAAGVGAPHIRQRLYFVAHARGQRREGKRLRVQPGQSRSARPETWGGSEARDRGGLSQQLEHSSSSRSGRNSGAVRDEEASREGEGRESRRERNESIDASADGRVGHAERSGLQARDEGDGRESGPDEPASDADDVGPGSALADAARLGRFKRQHERGAPQEQGGPRPADNLWSSPDWLPCTDGVSRPVEPGTFPLAHGVPARVGRLRGYGNAIVPQVAAAFIRAALEGIEEVTPTPTHEDAERMGGV